MINITPQSHTCDWNSYAAGYKRAGDLVAEHAPTQLGQHTLVYPAVFLYRHYIELRLKEIVGSSNWLVGKPPESLKKRAHNINDLWRKCRDNLEKVDEDELKGMSQAERNKWKSEYDAIEEDINRFSEWDPDSTAFRYPTDKNGNPSISDLRGINFRNPQELIERISYSLDGISVGISEYLNAKHEMQAELGQLY